jgi:phosphatidylglycerophosphate synthase
MIEAILRPTFQKKFVDPIARAVVKVLTPHFITFLAVVSGIAIIPALVFDDVRLACILLLVSGYLDILDGTVAQLKANTTPVGAMLDIVGDRIVEFAVILGLYLVDPLDRGTVSLFVLGSILICVTSFLVVGIFTPNESKKGFHYSPGLIERFEAFIFFFAMILFPSAFNVLGIIMTLLIIFTALVRVMEFCCNQIGRR